MKHLNESILSKKTGMYNRPKPDLESVVDWLDAHGFKEIPYFQGARGTEHLDYKERTYMVFSRKIEDRYIGQDWISIHTPKIDEVIFWFDKDHALSKMSVRYKKHIDRMTPKSIAYFDDMIEEIYGSIK